MPEYFFHVAIEILSDPQAGSQVQHTSRGLSAGVEQALAPLLPLNSHTISTGTVACSQQQSHRHKHHQHPHAASNPTLAPSRHISEQLTPVKPDDHRFDHIYIDGTDMSSQRSIPASKGSASEQDTQIDKGIGTSTAGVQTKGRYVPLEREPAEGGWGIVHLYRDADETPGLYGDHALRSEDIWSDGLHKKPVGKPHPPPKDEECTTLCILAVPSYLAPADFLAFVGEETRNEVSHFRMIKTSRANRYMVLMKFRHGKKAREWQHEWNGKVFNSMEPETCHVVFLKSVEILHSPFSTDSTATDTTYPKTPNDPFSTPSTSTAMPPSATTKPLPPPTPSLVELPTCPVCLERMDETTGLLTILCQHVFHCTCLQKWSGGGCPVCRYTHDDFSSRLGGSKSKHKIKNKNLLKNAEYDIDDYDGYGAETGQLECETCHIEENLWQCLICGKVGCGRYEGKHAYGHFEETGHAFSMDLESGNGRVWDYGGDGYVHRIIQDGREMNDSEKLSGLDGMPGQRRQDGRECEDVDVDKSEGLALEYTHLLTSQLESQRVYFEGVVERAVDKASEAGRRAGVAGEEMRKLSEEVQLLRREQMKLREDVVPSLEKERDRAAKRAERFEVLSREMERKWREEKAHVEGLLERVAFVEAENGKIKEKVGELEEENRDLMLNFSMGEKLQQLAEAEKGETAPGDGDGDRSEWTEGTIGVPEPEKKESGGGASKRRKGKGRK